MSVTTEKPSVLAPKKPYPFQEAVIRKISKRDRIALFMEMRLGKTLCSIKWLAERKCQRTLIVCPLSVVPVWEKELAAEGIASITVATMNKDLLKVIQLWPGIVITNFEALSRTELADMEWDCVLLDEAHRIRRMQSKVSKICAESFGNVRCKAILTGTPAPESLLDYYQQFRFLLGHFLGITSYYEFKNSYFYTSYGNPKPQIKIAMVPIVKEFIGQNSIILRRSNPLVMKNLKNTKIYQQRYTVLSPEAQKLYDQFEREWFLKALDQEKNKDVFTNWVIVAQNYMHQMSGGFIKGNDEFFSPHKLEEMKEVLENEVQGERVVVFCRFRKEMDKIQSYFQNEFKIRQIHGNVNVHTRMEYIDELGEDKINLLVCQIKTAGVGINMSCCDTCFYYSNTWENADRLQSEDRLVGPKTDEKSSLLYIDFLTQKTIDVDLYNALLAKKKNTDLDFLSSVYNTWKERMSQR